MKRYYYFPSDDLGRLNWHATFIDRFKLVATLLGFLPAEVTALENDLKAHQFIYTLLGISNSFKMNLTTYKVNVLEGPISATPRAVPDIGTLPVLTTPVEDGIFKRIYAAVRKIKNSPNYTENIGKDLGIIGAENVIIPEEMQPDLTFAGSKPYHNIINFNKQGMEGVRMFGYTYQPGVEPGKSEDEIVFENLGVVLHSPYLDKRGNFAKHPETRLYKAVYIKDDKLVGLESEILRVVTEIYVDEQGNELSGSIK